MHLLNIRFEYSFFYKHMKFRNQARLCLAIFHFEAHIMLSLFFKVLDYRLEKSLTQTRL